ncbi:hypothetical protein P4123_23605 [Pseudomonas aeruginosa]|nr:hypothetical protein [Pseudomonas aeruginosa]
MQTARYSELGFFAFVERKSSFILKIIKKNSKEAAIPFHKKLINDQKQILWLENSDLEQTFPKCP